MGVPSLAQLEAGLEARVDAWCREDHARSLLPSDHQVVEATRSLRALVMEGIAGGVAERDLLHACWLLGHLTGTQGGSPTLLGSTLENARAVACPAEGGPPSTRNEEPWISMRAALVEGFAAARADLARAEAAAAWDYPHCAVRIDQESVALAGGYPDDDAAAIEVWAGRVAQRVACAGFRRAFLSGRADVCRALEDALSLVGIRVMPADDPRGECSESWNPRAAWSLRALWKRSPKEK